MDTSSSWRVEVVRGDQTLLLKRQDVVVSCLARMFKVADYTYRHAIIYYRMCSLFSRQNWTRCISRRKLQWTLNFLMQMDSLTCQEHSGCSDTKSMVTTTVVVTRHHCPHHLHYPCLLGPFRARGPRSASDDHHPRCLGPQVAYQFQLVNFNPREVQLITVRASSNTQSHLSCYNLTNLGK